MNYYLAIDIGASSGRHILAHLQDGKMVTEEIYRFSNGPQILPGTPGALGSQGNKRLMWDTERLFKEILNGLKRAKELNKIPVSVGVDTWGVDYVLLDESDTPLEGVYCYRDGRTKSAVPSAHRRIPFAELYAKTGIQYQSFNTVYQLYDDKRDGRLQKAKTFLMLPDYFHYLLTGVKRQEYTNATTTGMVNALTHAWDEEILDALGYDKKLFGALSQPGTAVGEFTDEVAAFVGYRAKVVLPATHDTASAVLAAPLEGQTPYISSGTWRGADRRAHFGEGARAELFQRRQRKQHLPPAKEYHGALDDSTGPPRAGRQIRFFHAGILGASEQSERRRGRQRRKIPRAVQYDRGDQRVGGQTAFGGRTRVLYFQQPRQELCGKLVRAGRADERAL